MRRRRMFNRGAWQIQRERFQLDEKTIPQPTGSDASVSEVIPFIMQRLGIREHSWLNALEKEWATLVGPAVAAHTRPGRLAGQTLIVFVDSAVWLSELERFGKTEILARLQARFGADKIPALRLHPSPGG